MVAQTRRRVVVDVVELGSSSVGLVVYRREEGGRNNEYHVNRCISMHDKTSNDARRALAWYEVVPVKGGKHSGKYPRCFVFSGRGAGGGKLRVR